LDDAERRKRLEALHAAPSYRLAQEDLDFLDRPELRPVRLQLELLKPELILTEERVESTIVVFGSTRILEPERAEARLAQVRSAAERDPEDPRLARLVRVAERLADRSHYYDAARAFTRLVSESCRARDTCRYVVVTGGGPGIMEAANRGAFDAGAKSIGLNITLPREQDPNPYITPELCFQFRYFALRKMHFLMRARALVVFPGGFGTLDELFDALTLRQTGRMQAIPIVLFGREYWERLLDFDFLADQGAIADEDLALFCFADTANEAWAAIRRFHGEGGG